MMSLKQIEQPRLRVVRPQKPFDEVKDQFIRMWVRIVRNFPDKKDEILSLVNSEAKPHGDDIKPEYVERVVSEYFGIPVAIFASKNRKTEYVNCRFAVFYILRKYTKMSFKNIGQLYGRNHTTAIHAIQTCNDLMETDEVYRRNINNIEKIVIAGLQKPRQE